MADTVAQRHTEPGRAGGDDVLESKLCKIEAGTVVSSYFLKRNIACYIATVVRLLYLPIVRESVP